MGIENAARQAILPTNQLYYQPYYQPYYVLTPTEVISQSNTTFSLSGIVMGVMKSGQIFFTLRFSPSYPALLVKLQNFIVNIYTLLELYADVRSQHLGEIIILQTALQKLLLSQCAVIVLIHPDHHPQVNHHHYQDYQQTS